MILSTHFATFFSISSPLCHLAIFFQRQKVNLKTLETFKKLSLEHLVDRVHIEKKFHSVIGKGHWPALNQSSYIHTMSEPSNTRFNSMNHPFWDQNIKTCHKNNKKCQFSKSSCLHQAIGQPTRTSPTTKNLQLGWCWLAGIWLSVSRMLW